MRRILRISTGALLWTAAMWAQPQVATVTSNSTFSLRGAEVTPGQGVPSWPVMAGDSLKAGSALMIVTFPDGSTVTLDPGSEGAVDFFDGKPVFQLLKGTVHYSLKSAGALQLKDGRMTVTPKGLNGAITFAPKAAAAGFWSAGHIAAVVVVGGVATGGLVYGVKQATSGGSQVTNP